MPYTAYLAKDLAKCLMNGGVDESQIVIVEWLKIMHELE